MEELLLKVVKNGKKRLIGKYKNIVSSVLISIVTFDNKEYIILEKRASHISQGGEISFPGGKFDQDDISTENTAIRECVEELGVKKDKIEVIGKFGTLVNPSGIVIDVYIGKIDIQNLTELDYNRDEVEKIVLVPMEFFLNNSPRIEKIGIKNVPLFSAYELGIPEKYAHEWNGKDRTVYFYEYDGEVIWGITAEIIYDFINALKK